jgi:hypothetical protein
MTSHTQCRVMKLSELTRDAGTNPRVALHPSIVHEYALAMRDGDSFPPVRAISDGQVYWLVDGYHRVAALEQNGTDSVAVAYSSGGLEEARWESCAANKAHGLHRSNEDKRLSVERALLTERGAHLSDRQIARYCGVHHDTVGRIRRRLVDCGRLAAVQKRIVARDGCSYSQNTEGVALANKQRILERVESLAREVAERTGRLTRDSGSHGKTQPARIRTLLFELQQLSERLIHELYEARRREPPRQHGNVA